MGISRTGDAFIALRDKLLAQITMINAKQLHEIAKDAVLEKLRTIEVKNITEVEDLYLIVALLTHTAQYIAAQKKADQDGILFDDAFKTIAVDDVSNVLIESFGKQPGVQDLLNKIKTIDSTHKPGKEVWAGLHSRMDLVAGYFSLHPVPITGRPPTKKTIIDTSPDAFIKYVTIKNLEAKLKAKLKANLKANLKALEDNIRKEPKNDKEKDLFAKAQEILNQAKKIAGNRPDSLSEMDLKDLNDVLICCNAALDDRHDRHKTIIHTKELASLAQRVSGKSSPNWKAIGNSLLTIACAALVVVGVLAAIPTGGGSLLLSAIGAAGMAASVGAGGLGVAFGSGAVLYGSEKGLAKSVSDFKNVLSGHKDEPDSGDSPSPGSPVVK